MGGFQYIFLVVHLRRNTCCSKVQWHHSRNWHDRAACIHADGWRNTNNWL